MNEKERARRNLDPHAEAICAMVIWGYEYAHKQCGGSMDFWDSLDDRRKRVCRDLVDRLKTAKPEAEASL